MTQTISQPYVPTLHPLWLRVMHWVNAFAVIVMTLSGWRIYDATSFWGFSIPANLTIGGWLGGALQWHFAAMWVLMLNGLVYMGVNIWTRRLWRKFFPIRLEDVVSDIGDFLKGRLSHDDLSHYNAVQKVLYVLVMLDILLVVVSGLVLFKSVQFPILRTVMFGFEGARRIHFIAMSGLVAFFAVHVSLSLLVPKSLRAMLTGA